MDNFIIDFKIKDNNIIITYKNGLKKTFPYTNTNRKTLLDYLESEKNIYTKLRNSLSNKKIIVVSLTLTDIFLTIFSYIKLNSILLKIFISLFSVFALKFLFSINRYLTNDINDINILLSYINKDNFLREEYLYTKHQPIIDFKKIKKLKEELSYSYNTKPKNNDQIANKNSNLQTTYEHPKVLSFTKK